MKFAEIIQNLVYIYIMIKLKKVNSFSVLKLDINNKKEMPSVINFITNKITYMREIIQNTILSIKYHKMQEIFSENDTKLSITILTNLYAKNEELYNMIIEDTITLSTEEIIDDLQKIIDKLSMIICGFGTKKITDLLFVSFGTEFKNMNLPDQLMQSKYDLILNYVQPTGYKLIHWKSGYQYVDTIPYKLCCDKQSDISLEMHTVPSVECFNIDYDTESFLQKMHGIQVIIQNEKAKKTLIISGMLSDIHIECLSSEYINERKWQIKNRTSTYDTADNEIMSTIIDNLTLKELLICGNDDIIKKLNVINTDISTVKKTNIDDLTKIFLEMNTYSQRCMLLNLLLYKKDKEIEYICYLLYDLLNNASGYNENIQQTIYDSFPWKIRNQMKDLVKYNMKYTNEMISKYESNKISLEQQICLMKADDSVKEKAMLKLKELNGRPDELGVKIKQYLEGLVRIPFGIYRKEPVLLLLKQMSKDALCVQNDINKLNASGTVSNKTKYTLNELSKFTHATRKTMENDFNKYIHKYLHTFTIKILNQIIKLIINDKNERKCVLKLCKNSKISTILENIETLDIVEHLKINTIIDTNVTSNQLYTNIINNTLNIEHNILKVNEDISHIETVLDESIYSHAHAKNQIMKIIGQWINGKQQGYCFGFEGSPGIGKTSLAKKGITKCLIDNNGESRPFAFIAMGGSSNGSSLEGHGYTYMNSTWGRIVDIIMETKCMNPIIYIDELDKVSNTENGKEIIGILTHLIDPTQNDSFQDKYFTGIDIDISKVLFIFSYNDAELIDRILLDRIHRIKFENLTLKDKMVIVNKYILPEINTKMGFDNIVTIEDSVIEHIITCYTCEPGVRKLKEIMFDLYGGINLELLKPDTDDNIMLPIAITTSNIETKYLTKYTKITEKKIYSEPRIGIINGLWANSLGMGGIIPIQTQLFPSSTFLELQLTGLQGDVMKESMTVAKTLAWSLTDDTTKKEWLTYFADTKCQGLHIHCPEGSISKDGPSAGTAITTAIFSLLNKKLIQNDVAITGEISLSGEVTAIGGLEIKINNGIRAGVKTILYPKENDREFIKWQKSCDIIDSSIKFIQVATIHDVFNHVFV
jgi:ATP-dependent Lon protease